MKKYVHSDEHHGMLMGKDVLICSNQYAPIDLFIKLLVSIGLQFGTMWNPQECHIEHPGSGTPKSSKNCPNYTQTPVCICIYT